MINFALQSAGLGSYRPAWPVGRGVFSYAENFPFIFHGRSLGCNEKCPLPQKRNLLLFRKSGRRRFFDAQRLPDIPAGVFLWQQIQQIVFIRNINEGIRYIADDDAFRHGNLLGGLDGAGACRDDEAHGGCKRQENAVACLVDAG